MISSKKTSLQKIGIGLDRFLFPKVKNGGLVVPSELAVPLTLGKEQGNESINTGITEPRKQARKREGTAGGRSWSPSKATPFIGAGLQTRYETELDNVARAYPGSIVWRQEEGMWLLAESSLLSDFQRAAIFLIGVSYATGTIRSWGFWKQPMANPLWIGPRHTNFPDGSICAFDFRDQTWVIGDSLVELLDFYTLWAIRHLHLEEFGRWPGPQVVEHPYERILELKADEYCGCGRHDKLYVECCQPGDLAGNRIRQAVNFVSNYSGGLRNPPPPVLRFIREQNSPPPLNELFGAG